jgi:hypothetical protein
MYCTLTGELGAPQFCLSPGLSENKTEVKSFMEIKAVKAYKLIIHMHMLV